MIRPYPAAIFSICVLLTYTSKKYMLASPLLPVDIAVSLSLVVLLLGCGVLTQSILQFRKMKTTIHPFRKPKILITDGAFSYSRNPIYLGLLLLLLAQAIFSNVISAVSGAITFFICMNALIIPKEEDLLKKLFSKAYIAYSAAVPRWFFII